MLLFIATAREACCSRLGHHSRSESLFYYFPDPKIRVPENHLLRPFIDRHVSLGSSCGTNSAVFL